MHYLQLIATYKILDIPSHRAWQCDKDMVKITKIDKDVQCS